MVSDSKVWVLDRRVFQQIMMRTGLQRLEDNINFLRFVPLLHNLSNDVLAKIADVLEVVSLFTIMSGVSRCDWLSLNVAWWAVPLRVFRLDHYNLLTYFSSHVLVSNLNLTPTSLLSLSLLIFRGSTVLKKNMSQLVILLNKFFSSWRLVRDS